MDFYLNFKLKMSRICIVVQNYYDIDPRVRRTVECLVDSGYSVDVFSLRSEEQSREKYKYNGVNIISISLGKKRASKLRYVLEYIIFFLWAFFRVTHYSLKQKYSVIHVNTLPDFLVYAGLIQKLFGATIILDMHEVMPEFYMSKFGVPKNHIIIKLIKWQERVSIRFADQVITINEPIKKLLENRNTIKNKITVVMNSVDNSLFSLQDSRINNHSNDKFIFMYHGTLTRLYGLDIAIRAFSKVCERSDDVEFWIIGEGPEKDNLKSIIQDQGIISKVKFIGLVPQQEIPSWLRKCDVGVLATRKDVFSDLSFSNKLPEYIITGKPVIISRLKTIRFYFSEQALAYFEPNNVDDLAKEMLDLFVNSKRRQNMVKLAQKEYQAINWDVMKHRYLNLIKATEN